MLQKIQEKSNGIILWIIVLLIGFAFLLWGLENPFQQSSNQNHTVIGSVAGLDVSKREFDKELEFVASQYIDLNKTGLDSLTPDMQQMLQQLTFKRIIQNKIIQAGYKKYGWGYSDNLILQEVIQSNIFKKDGKFSQALFEEYMRSQGYTEKSFLEDLGSRYVYRHIGAALLDSEFVTKSELDYWVSIFMQKRDFRVLKIPLNAFVNEMKVTKEEAKDYYENNLQSYQVPEKIKLAYVEFDKAKLLTEVTVTEQELLDYYNENQRSFFNPKKWRLAHIQLHNAQSEDTKKLAEDILNKLNSAEESFASLAKKYSKDFLTAANGGELYWLNEDMMDEDIKSVISQLDKPNDVAKPIEIDGKIEIFTLLEVQDESYKPYDKVKDKIEISLTARKNNEIFTEKLEYLADLAYENPESLGTIQDKLGLEIKETEWFAKGQQLDSGILQYKQVLNSAYHEDVYENKHNSLPIVINNDIVVLVRIADTKAARTMSYDEVADNIKQEILLTKSAKQVENTAKEIIDKLRQGEDDLSKYGKLTLSWEIFNDIDLEITDANPKIIEMAYNISSISSKNKSFPAKVVEDSYVIVDVTKLHAVNFDKVDDKQLKRIADHIQFHRGQLVFEQYFANLEKAVKVKLPK